MPRTKIPVAPSLGTNHDHRNGIPFNVGPGRLEECAGKRPIFHHTLAAARWPLGYRNVRLLIN